jgi:hypothetical protein
MMKKKKAFIEIDGKMQWLCEYKNCRNVVKAGYIVCEKHIGQTEKDQNSPKMRERRAYQAAKRVVNRLK